MIILSERTEKIYRKLHLLSILIGFLSVLLPILFWKRIPERIPMHYNAAGMIDRWGDKSTLILLFFVIVLMIGMMSIVVFVIKTNMHSTYAASQEKNMLYLSYQALILMNLMLQGMFAYIVFCCATGRTLGIFFLPVFLVGIFLPLSYAIVKSRKIRLKTESEKAQLKQLEQEEKGKVYRSAVDWWLALLLIGTELMMIWFSIEPVISKGKISYGMIITSIVVSVLLWPLCKIRYVLYRTHMMITMGFYGTVRIRYADIVSLKKTNNPLSSAAMSLKRIQIDYIEKGVRQMILISPKNREEFIGEINCRL